MLLPKKIIIILVAVIVVVTLAYLYYNNSVSNLRTARAEINGAFFEADVADNYLTRKKGLSGRLNLAPDQAMLFIFDKKDYYSFWMKEMEFPIDIIWIDDQTVVGIEKNIQPPAAGRLFVYRPEQKVNLVLEIGAGLSDQRNIKIGDLVDISYSD